MRTRGCGHRAREQIPRSYHRQGDYVRAVVINVDKSAKGPQVILSRTHPDFLRRLFEAEVPEIADSIVEIKAVAREAGARSKISVYSTDPRVDAVGSCVGLKGSRVQSIVRELGGERIDIVPWSQDPTVFVSRALSPARVMDVRVVEAEKRMVVIVADDQLSLAIGKGGQNARLAARLTGWKIDLVAKSEEKKRQDLERASRVEVEKLSLGEATTQKLISAGIETVQELVAQPAREADGDPGHRREDGGEAAGRGPRVRGRAPGRAARRQRRASWSSRPEMEAAPDAGHPPEAGPAESPPRSLPRPPPSPRPPRPRPRRRTMPRRPRTREGTVSSSQGPKKLRVYEVAKDLGMSSEAVLLIVKRLGVEVKNHMSTLPPEAVTQVQAEIGKEKTAVKEEMHRQHEQEVTRAREERARRGRRCRCRRAGSRAPVAPGAAPGAPRVRRAAVAASGRAAAVAPARGQRPAPRVRPAAGRPSFGQRPGAPSSGQRPGAPRRPAAGRSRGRARPAAARPTASAAATARRRRPWTSGSSPRASARPWPASTRAPAAGTTARDEEGGAAATEAEKVIRVTEFITVAELANLLEVKPAGGDHRLHAARPHGHDQQAPRQGLDPDRGRRVRLRGRVRLRVRRGRGGRDRGGGGGGGRSA